MNQAGFTDCCWARDAASVCPDCLAELLELLELAAKLRGRTSGHLAGCDYMGHGDGKGVCTCEADQLANRAEDLSRRFAYLRRPSAEEGQRHRERVALKRYVEHDACAADCECRR